MATAVRKSKQLVSISGNVAHTAIDAWAELMRQDNPEFGALSLREITEGLVLDNVLPKILHPDINPASPAAAALKPLTTGTCTAPDVYDCATQRRNAVDELFIGIHPELVTLWESGSVINWIARADGYRSQKDAIIAAQACYSAAEAWNRVLGGRVSFNYVERFDDACFQLAYNKRASGGTLAVAFFPDEFDTALNNVLVYPAAFSPDYIGIMPNVFAHELGHVLGLRHEFAQYDPEHASKRPPVEDSLGGAESILVGARNPNSVMAYVFPPVIQRSDVTDCCSAYDEYTHGRVFTQRVLTQTGITYDITKTVDRVKPNN